MREEKFLAEFYEIFYTAQKLIWSHQKTVLTQTIEKRALCVRFGLYFKIHMQFSMNYKHQMLLNFANNDCFIFKNIDYETI